MSTRWSISVENTVVFALELTCHNDEHMPLGCQGLQRDTRFSKSISFRLSWAGTQAVKVVENHDPGAELLISYPDGLQNLVDLFVGMRGRIACPDERLPGRDSRGDDGVGEQTGLGERLPDNESLHVFADVDRDYRRLRGPDIKAHVSEFLMHPPCNLPQAGTSLRLGLQYFQGGPHRRHRRRWG